MPIMSKERLSQILAFAMDFEKYIEVYMNLLSAVLNRLDELWVDEPPVTNRAFISVLNEQMLMGASITHSLIDLCVEKKGGLINELMLQMLFDVTNREVIVTDFIASEFERLRDAKTQKVEKTH